MSETTTSITPSAKAEPALRFPLATVGQVRREVARQLGQVRSARWWFLLAVALLGLGSYATVLVPQLMGQIVDLVLGVGPPGPCGGSAVSWSSCRSPQRPWVLPASIWWRGCPSA